MTNHNTRQSISVVNPAVPKHTWLVLFDYAKRCGVTVDIHSDETSYHAEEMLRIWAASENLSIGEIEMTPDVGSPYINLRVSFKGSEYGIASTITIYRIRELLRVEPEADELPEDYGGELGHDDGRGVYADGAEADSNEILGLSQEFSR